MAEPTAKLPSPAPPVPAGAVPTRPTGPTGPTTAAAPAAPKPAVARSPQALIDPQFLARLDELVLLSRKIFTGRLRGERRSKKRGISVEFADYRDYSPGDDIRFIDWNIYGRLSRLFLKLFLEEEDLHVYCLIDSSLSMAYGEPVKFEYALKVAAAIGYIALANHERIGIGAYAGERGEYFRPVRGRKQMWRIFNFLGTLSADGKTNLAAAAKSFSVRARRNGILVLISDFLDPAGYEGVLRTLIGRGMDLYCIHLLSKEEVEPELAGDLRLVDVETAAVTDITISRRLLETYRRTVQSYCASLKDFCTARGATYLFTTTEVPFETLILSYLRSGGLVR